MQLEGEATARAVRLASFVNTPLYVVHVMSIDAMEEIAKARKSGKKRKFFLQPKNRCIYGSLRFAPLNQQNDMTNWMEAKDLLVT